MPVRIAIDVGTSGGKIHYGCRDGDDLTIDEAYRFETRTREVEGRVVWDIDHLLSEVVTGLELVQESTSDTIASVGIDTTAGDFGLIADGELIRNPYCYLDTSLYSKNDEVLTRISREEAFQITGYNGIPGSIYYQYHSEPELFERADQLLTLPQLLSFELGAKPSGEETFATTLRISDARTRDWASELIEVLELPTDVLPELHPPGTKVGTLSPSVSDQFDSEADILLTPSHDTAAAMAAVPFEQDSRGFLATGSWVIPGLELPEPVITENAFERAGSNELSVGGAIRFLQNVPGFSLLEHCRETWEVEGGIYEHDELLEAVRSAAPYGPLIDPADELFFRGHMEGNVVDKIQQYCRETGQTPPEREGEIARCVSVCLAARSAIVLESLIGAAETHTERIHLIGGGVRNPVFCQMVASAAGLPVKAGPVEATAVGNLLSQMNAGGDIESYEAGRDLIEANVDFDHYEPADHGEWNDVIGRMYSLVRSRET
jgi:rhamnulokinase